MTPALRLPRGLYGITPQTTDFDALGQAIDQAAAGGMKTLQWRQKLLPAHVARPLAEHVAQRCKALGVTFIVNDDIELALAVQADGVHLGKDDGNLGSARQRLGPHKIIGCSCYNDLALAEAAVMGGADYIAFGAVFTSSVKPDAVHAPLSLFSQARSRMPAVGEGRVALVAIGGITTDNATSVVSAGADSLAVIGGLFDQPDIRATAAQFSALF